MRFKSKFEAALYVWDYFYCANTPRSGDEKAWSAIESATDRIREPIQYLVSDTRDFFRKPTGFEIREMARRVRRGARDALRNIERLSRPPEQWVIDELVGLEKHAEDFMTPRSTDVN